MGKRKEQKEIIRKLTRLLSGFCELFVDEIDNWVYGITHKDFSGLIQFYRENEDIFFKYSKYLKLIYQYHKPYLIKTEKWITRMKIFMHRLEIRNELAKLLNEASILDERKDFEQALKYYKKCIETRRENTKIYKSLDPDRWFNPFGDFGPHDPFRKEKVQVVQVGISDYKTYKTYKALEDILDEKRRQVYLNHRKIQTGKYEGEGRWSQDIEDMYDTKFKHFIKKRISKIESELETVDYYKRNIDYLNRYLNQKKYNQAFNYYIKSLSYKDKIINKDHFLDKEKEKKIEKAVKNIILNLSNIIKRTVLDLSTKFTRIEIKEIREKCEVDYEDLIIKVIKEMIKNKEVYAEYFKSSNSISFNQQVNIAEIDKLLDQYRQWEEEGISKK